ncbi:zeta toxin family protein [Clostridium estertheticum]|uniref:zeta toxin family protein n=1 Tax=Clostridium estertheticum TaxID=238834 RepID=UPI001C7E11BA|nr:zeta toxin family protein [Clostridium estertheticum]MBX4267149.1 zeta toxin family protein [Clostridium estertheticum]MBX4272015.1 zeta toxin family protein [Clostridium estertheticum]WLC82399.1 zeta toxin family protein [Clostridium estertheticum]WLC91272.1 zeta toxin family protein [Clostridium estertheticum]
MYNKNEKPNYTVFAGINGAGKSTLYEDVDKELLGVRINADEIAKEIGDFNDPKVQLKAGRIAVKKMRTCIKDKVNFNQETVLSGKSTIVQMQKLKNEGYKIRLMYIGLENKELAVKRVAERVKNGGHNIPKALIYERYNKSLENLKLAMKLADEIRIYDNSKEQQERETLFAVKDNKIIYEAEEIPMWFEDIHEHGIKEIAAIDKDSKLNQNMSEPKDEILKSEKSKDDEFMKEYLEKQRRKSLAKEHKKDLEIER